MIAEADVPAPPRPPWSLRWLLPVLSVCSTCLLVGSVAVVGERSARRALTAELVQRLCAEASSVALLARSAMLTPYPELTLYPALLSTRQQTRELSVATVTDRSGTILGDGDPGSLGKRFRQPPGMIARSSSPVSGVQVLESPTLIMAAASVVHPNGALLGTAYLAVPRGYIDGAVSRTRRPVLILLAVLVFAGVLGSFLLTSALLRPMASLQRGLERIGGGDLGVRLDERGRTEFGLLAGTINRMTRDLRHAHSEAMERERLAHEMELAQRIQRSLLPREPVVRGPFVLCGTQRQAQEVGGDFYDTFVLPNGGVGIAIADVAGKGLGGCLVTSMVAALLATLREQLSSPAALLASLDRTLSSRLDRGIFVTMFVGFVDPERGELVYASAGHHPALLVHADRQAEWLRESGAAIGADRKAGIERTLRDATVRLTPGDLLVQTTDGIHETEDGPEGEQFGFDRLATAVSGLPDLGVRSVLERLPAIAADWRGHGEPADDETVVALRWTPEAELDEATRPLELLAEARSRGSALVIPPTLDALVRLDIWLDRLVAAGTLAATERAGAALVLHELCANIVEHGGVTAEDSGIRLWWVPGEERAPDLRPGHFIIHDHGRGFAAKTASTVDYGDPQRRRAGRGLGLDLVARYGARVARHPTVPTGNLTQVSFSIHEQQEAI